MVKESVGEREGDVGGGGVVLPFRRPGAVEEAAVDQYDDDGWMVDAWLEEMSTQTGSKWLRRSVPVGNLRNLAATLGANIPLDGDRCAPARRLAADYCASQRGQTLSVFKFIDWMQNGRRTGPKKAELQPHDGAVDLKGEEWK